VHPSDRHIRAADDLFTALGLSAMSSLSGVVVGTILMLVSGLRLGNLLPLVEAALVGVVAGPVLALFGASLAVRAAGLSPRFRTRASLDDAWFYSVLMVGVVVGLAAALAVVGR